jgi:tetratricopeptide (TPR) repeat protein
MNRALLNQRQANWVTKLWCQLFLSVLSVLLLINTCGAKLYAATADEALTQGEILLNNRDYNGAIRAFDKSISDNSNDSLAYSYRGLAHFRLHEYQKAIDDCSKAMPLDPNNALVYYYRAAAYLELHAYEKAVQDCTTAIRLVPSQSAVVLIARARVVGA